MDEEHDSFSCEECTVQIAQANHHTMQIVVSCMSDYVIWSCKSCDITETWIVNDDVEATNEIIRTFMNMHCIDHFALVVE